LEANLTLIFQTGDVVDGRYRILNSLGTGGMGGVFLAEQLNFGRQVALKVLHDQTAEDAISRERFTREARAVCHLKHPNLVVYHDFGTDSTSGRLYLAMEYLQGRSLDNILDQAKPIPIDRVVHILVQLCGALKEAHTAGVIHRDLKPSNVMLVRRAADMDFVKLIDFGISRILSGSGRSGQSEIDLTETGMIIGTTAYLAPEYIQRQVVDQRTDIYALGVMMYELIAGHRPFQSTDRVHVLFQHLNEDPIPLDALPDGRQVPSALSATVLQALAKDPEKRFGSVADLEQALLDAVAPLLDSAAIGATTHHTLPVALHNAPVTGADVIPASAEDEAATQALPYPVGAKPPVQLGTEPTLSTQTPWETQPRTGRRTRLAIALSGLALVALFGVWAMGGFQSQSNPGDSTAGDSEQPAEAAVGGAAIASSTAFIEQPATGLLTARRLPAAEVESQPYTSEASFAVRPPKARKAAKSSDHRSALADLLSRAKAAKIKGDWATVSRAYKDAYKQSPAARYLKQIGMAQLKLGNRAEACRYFQRSVARTAAAKRADAIERLAVYGCELSL